mmetsp:Transcript_16392/g.33794  ORF Transcript_16392/g.33794 Transcript_16392/m.33794 type:complete len:322 (+) Transcript_16392:607-1572(+)
MANFSFKARERTGQIMDKVGASTVTTKVVPINSETALFVSAGLHTALTTAEIAGRTSGFGLVLQIANKHDPAALLTWVLVSQTWPVTPGINSGRALQTCRVAVSAHWARRSKAFTLTRHSADFIALSKSGQMRLGKTKGFASLIRAEAASSAASRTELELLPHSSRAAVMNAPTTYGSAVFPTISQKARIRRREPSLAFAGVAFPRLESVPVVTSVIVVISSVAMLARLNAEALGFKPPEVSSLLSKVFKMPSGKSIFCISSMTWQSLRTKRTPNFFAAVATSAAAPDRSLVVLAVWGLLLSVRICSPMASRHMTITLVFC